MRRFCSYGPVNKRLHYYVPRTELLAFGKQQLLGHNFADGGHYMTVWAPRQRGKTWLMGNILWELQEDERLDVLKLNIQHLQGETRKEYVLRNLGQRIKDGLELEFPDTDTDHKFERLFSPTVLRKPLILIIDEFDALEPEIIGHIVRIFRNIYITRQESPQPTHEKPYLLHGVALVGVKAVLGVDNRSGSPFNVQRSLSVPNLTYDEVNSMFQWYIEESGQQIEQAVIDRLYYVLQGQPGLTSWLGELLTETYNSGQPTITMKDFTGIYNAAIYALPNANVMNLVSKANEEPHRELVLRVFETDEKIPFDYNNPSVAHLYLNGVIDEEIDHEAGKRYIKFPSQFVQERLFGYFAHMLYQDMDRLYNPFMDLSDTITETTINLKNILRLYEAYIHKNKDWLFKQAPRRKSDLRIMEATYHFTLYMYLKKFMYKRGDVLPEFPTGNGKVDLLLLHNQQRYVLELKSYKDTFELKQAIHQVANYGQSLGLTEVTLVMFVESVPTEVRQQLETKEPEANTGVIVDVVLVDVIQ